MSHPFSASGAYIIVNDGPAVNISSLNLRAGYHDSTPVQLKLRDGDVNTIVFGSNGDEGNASLSVYAHSTRMLTNDQNSKLQPTVLRFSRRNESWARSDRRGFWDIIPSLL